jgi:hypothetical protein
MVINEGRGGAYVFQISEQDYARLETYAKNLPKFPLGFGSNRMLNHSPETVIGKLVNDFEHIQRLKRLCKNNLVFTLKGDKPEVFSSVKGQYSPEEAAWLRKEYPNLDRFYNEEFLKEEQAEAEIAEPIKPRRLPPTIAKRKVASSR